MMRASLPEKGPLNRRCGREPCGSGRGWDGRSLVGPVPSAQEVLRTALPAVLKGGTAERPALLEGHC